MGNQGELQMFEMKNLLIRKVGGSMLLEAQKKKVKRQALLVSMGFSYEIQDIVVWKTYRTIYLNTERVVEKSSFVFAFAYTYYMILCNSMFLDKHSQTYNVIEI